MAIFRLSTEVETYFDRIIRMILLTVILMDLLAGMEFDLFVPSFPELQKQFSLSPFWVAALLSSNFAGYCLSLFFVGELADRYGRKPIILLGVMTFIIGTILCLWPASYEFILFGRFLQGIGIAAPAILSFLIIADTYPLKKQQFLMGILNGSMNAAAAVAPVIGSYITMYFYWQGNFKALLFLGLTTLIMVMFFIPNYKLPQQKPSQLLRDYYAIFQSKSLILLVVTILFIFVPYWIFVGISPLLYIKDLGVKLSHFGYYQGTFALVFAFGSLLYALILRLYSYDQKKMLFVSVLIFMVSLITLGCIIFLNSANALLITLAFLPFIIGQVIPSTILYPLCLNYIPQSKGRIAAIIQGGRLIFAALGLQIAGYFYQGSFRNIGITISVFIILAIVTLFFVINNNEIMNSHVE